MLVDHLSLHNIYKFHWAILRSRWKARIQQCTIPTTINILFERIFCGSNNNTCAVYISYGGQKLFESAHSHHNDRQYYLLDDAVNIFLITSCLPYNNKQTWTRTHMLTHKTNKINIAISRLFTHMILWFRILFGTH